MMQRRSYLSAILVCALIAVQFMTGGVNIALVGLPESWSASWSASWCYQSLLISSVATDSTSLPSSAFLSSMNLTREDLYERNFFYQAWMADANTKRNASEDAVAQLNPIDGNDQKMRMSHPLAPMDVLIRYISEHSHQRLEQEWNEACQHNTQQQQGATASACRLDETTGSHRKYLVASYSCPIESGNRLHRFMHGLMWAVLTNRTFLWRYQTKEICEEYDEPACANEYNTNLITGPSDCDGMLERSPWIPSYDEWRDRLGMAKDHSDLVRAQTHKDKADATTQPYDDPDGSGAIRVLRSGKQVLLNPGDILTVPISKTKFLVQPESRERLRDLRTEGIYFLYGMLFESIFTMDPSLDPPPELLHTHPSFAAKANSTGGNDPAVTTTDTETIFIHSRHSGQHADDYVWPDHMCLERLYPSNETDSSSWSAVQAYLRQPRPARCHIYVMSDRSITLKLLHEEIENMTGCTSSSSDQAPGNNSTATKTTGVSFRSEHGVRAGRGYWEDVALAVHARNGMIAFSMYHRHQGLVRTSTALVREIIEFRRRMEHHRHHENGGPARALPEFYECTNPWVDDKNFNIRKNRKEREGGQR